MIVLVGRSLGLEIFPKVDAGRFQLRLRAPDGTRIEETEQLAIAALETIGKEVGRDKVEISIGYVGLIPSSYPINAIYQWTGGPEEAILRVALKEGAKVDIERLKERLRAGACGAIARRAALVRAGRHRQRGDELRLADAGRGRRHRAEPRRRTGPSPRSSAASWRQIPSLRDLQYGQSLDYPTVSIEVDRERAGLERRHRRRRSPARSSRPPRRAASWCPTTGPTPRPASATRSRSRSPTRSWTRSSRSRRCRSRRPVWTGSSCSATWRRSARGRCRANTTATT